MADTAVVTHTEHDIAHVGADRLAHGCDGVHETDLGGEEGVRRVLDGLGRGRIGHHDRRGEADVEAGHADRGGLISRSDHDPVGVQEVVDRGTLTQELRVRYHGDVAALQRPLHPAGGPDGDRRLVDDDRIRREHRPDLTGRRLDVGEVGGAVIALRRRHAEVHEFAIGNGVGGAHDELETAGAATFDHQVLESVLEDRDLAVVERRDLPLIDVSTHHVVAHVGKTCPGRQTHVASSDHSDLGDHYFPVRDDVAARHRISMMLRR